MELELILRLLTAIALGGAIGLEREYRAKEAGLRTHFLVALGSCLFMIISIYGFHDIVSSDLSTSFDPSRIASQVVTGIGFIGAGTIIFQKHVIKGLTTASGLWVTSAIGLACGTGMYHIAIATTLLVLMCLEALNFFLRKYGKKNIFLTLSAANIDNANEAVKAIGQANNDKIYNVSIKRAEPASTYIVVMELNISKKALQSHIIDIVKTQEGITLESIE